MGRFFFINHRFFCTFYLKAGDIEKAEYGHPKDDTGAPVVNYAVAYDLSNQEPLLYQSYPGSIVDELNIIDRSG